MSVHGRLKLEHSSNSRNNCFFRGKIIKKKTNPNYHSQVSSSYSHSPYFPLAALFMAHMFLIKKHAGSALLGLVLAGSCVLGSEKIKVKNQACGGRRYGVWRVIFLPSSLLHTQPVSLASANNFCVQICQILCPSLKTWQAC